MEQVLQSKLEFCTRRIPETLRFRLLLPLQDWIGMRKSFADTNPAMSMTPVMPMIALEILSLILWFEWSSMQGSLDEALYLRFGFSFIFSSLSE
ncbi:hypothetical protein NZ30_13115 [Xanthomonas translucens pv. undulosa]|nr:hypothetical protein NZ30_13115 [Xanthomonas translucens pv. undulosa]